MIEGKSFIYLDNFKTGSTFIKYTLKKHFPESSVRNGNINKISCINKKNKMLISSLRDPFKIYVSLWAYGCNKDGLLFNKLTNKSLNSRFSCSYIKNYKPKKYVFSFLSHYKINNPKEWEILYSNQKSLRNFNTWLYKINSKNSYFKTKLNAPIEFNDGRKIGFLSRRILKSFFSYSVDQKGRLVYESIKPKVDQWILTDTPEIMKIYLEKIIDEIRLSGEAFDKSQVVSLKEINKSNHLDHNLYYDKKSKEFIKKNDSFYFELYKKIKKSF